MTVQVLDGQVVIETVDEHQYVRIASTGTGSDTVRELPDAFRVVAVEQDGDLVVLRADDGSEVRATPGQLALPGTVIPAHLNPDHQADLAAELFGLATVPALDADDPQLTATLHDERLGEVVFDPVDGVGAHDVPTPVGDIQIRFWAAGHDRVRTLLPLTHELLDQLPQVRDAAVEFLWQWGATGGDTAEGHEQFRTNFGVQGLSVYHSGAFAVELSDDQTVFAESFLDGYWPAVHFLPNGEPVFITTES
ncbi:MAG: hypothetical protein LBU50_07645 [Cellulomonas sp.]|jgi:hypothetical protein|nr:hypothetical protein [Cellulomonas sp.]